MSNPRESGSPTPTCETVLRADRAEWRDPEELTEGLAAFKDPCGACFPDGEPEIGTEIVRSTACSTPTYHRPAEPDPEREADGGTEAVADGGVLAYECDECGELVECDVDETGQRRCPDCGRAVTAVVSDGGSLRDLTVADSVERHLSELLQHTEESRARFHARSALQHLARLEERDRS